MWWRGYSDNCTAVVLEPCTLKENLKDELESIGYSGDASQHIYNFINEIVVYILHSGYGSKTKKLLNNHNSNEKSFNNVKLLADLLTSSKIFNLFALQVAVMLDW